MKRYVVTLEEGEREETFAALWLSLTRVGGMCGFSQYGVRRVGSESPGVALVEAFGWRRAEARQA